MYYTYMIRCKDNSIYTGITTDLERRTKEHITKDEKCAKYTYFHTAIKLEMAWISKNRVDASKLEYRIKHLTKAQKELLIKDNSKIQELLESKIDCENYTIVSKKIINNIWKRD